MIMNRLLRVGAVCLALSTVLLPRLWLLAADDKRIHTFEELRHATEGWLSATSEGMALHVDMGSRKTAPFPPDIAARIRAVMQAHSTVPRPDGTGRRIAMPAK